MTLPRTSALRGLLACTALAFIATMVSAGCSRGQPDQRPASEAPVPQASVPAANVDPAPADAPAAAKSEAEANLPDDAGNVATSNGATIGGDGSEITLSPLSAQDIEAAALAGELACAFSTRGDEALLLAKGDVASDDPARGMVKVGDYVEAIAAPGGFDAMLRGTRFAGAGKTVTVAITGAATGGGESPPSPATLTYERADGARREFSGQWRCGP